MKFFFAFILVTNASLFALRNTPHPGYNLHNIRPNNFNPKVTGIDFLSDGKLVLTTSDLKQGQHSYNDDAEVYLITGTEGTNNNNTQTQTYATGLKDVMGVAVVNDTVYISQRDALTRLVDSDGNGSAEVQENVLAGWVQNDRMWTYGPAYHNGNFYLAVSVNHATGGGYGDNGNHNYRGCVLKVSPSGQAEIIAGGLRNPNGITTNLAGDVFYTDNQGQWFPHNKFVHVEESGFYGHPNTPFEPTSGGNYPQDPPAVWLIQGEVNNSPTHPEFITQGRFAGQYLLGDVTRGGIRRVFLEKVNGKYQGAVLDWGNGLEVGINYIKEGPSGDLFAGGLGDGSSGGWGWNGTTFGLQKLSPNNNVVFELLAVRSLASGFQLEFSEPVGTNAESASNYSILRWGVNPQQGYGAGAKVNSRTITPQGISISTDRKLVTFTLNTADLQHESSLQLPSTVFSFNVSDIQSQAGDSIWTEMAWYTLNNIGPADILGCMDNTYQEYNSLAEYDDGLQCITPSVSIQPTHSGFKWKPATVYNTGLSIELHLPYLFPYTGELIDIKGKKYLEFDGKAPKTISMKKSDMPSGIYWIHLRSSNALHTQKISVH